MQLIASADTPRSKSFFRFSRYNNKILCYDFSNESVFQVRPMYFFPASRGSKKLDLVTLSGVGKLGKQLCLVVIYCNSRYFHTFADYNITRSQVWSKLFSYVQHQQIARIRSLYSSNEQFMNNFIVVFNAKLTNEVNCETWPRVYLMLSLKNDHKNCIIC